MRDVITQPPGTHSEYTKCRPPRSEISAGLEATISSVIQTGEPSCLADSRPTAGCEAGQIQLFPSLGSGLQQTPGLNTSHTLHPFPDQPPTCVLADFLEKNPETQKVKGLTWEFKD